MPVSDALPSTGRSVQVTFISMFRSFSATFAHFHLIGVTDPLKSGAPGCKIAHDRNHEQSWEDGLRDAACPVNITLQGFSF